MDADHGSNFVPGAGPERHAPQSLDHFKRGYAERAELRDREMSNLDEGNGAESGATAKGIKAEADSKAPVKNEDPRAQQQDQQQGGPRGDRGGPPHHHQNNRYDNRDRDRPAHRHSHQGGRGGGGHRNSGGPSRNDMTFREYRRWQEENPQFDNQNHHHGGGRGGGGRGGGYRRHSGGYHGHHGGGSHIIKGTRSNCRCL